jgi:hypothetical protein
MKKYIFEFILKKVMKLYGYEVLTYTIHDTNYNSKDNCIAITFSMNDNENQNSL